MAFKMQWALLSSVFFFHVLVLNPLLQALGFSDVFRENRICIPLITGTPLPFTVMLPGTVLHLLRELLSICKDENCFHSS